MTLLKFTEDDVRTACEMREAGKSIEEIQKATGMSRGTIDWHCLRNGAEPPAHRRHPVSPRIIKAEAKRGNHTVRRFTPEEDAQLLKLEAEGVPLSEIARSIGRKHNSVLGRLATLARIEARREEEAPAQ